jgi:hydroxyacylglutathione hydrolase
VRALERAGCKPGSLKLIILTHGDFDHTGNAKYLRTEYGPKIMMHSDDVGMIADGDMFVSREKSNILIKIASRTLFGFGRSERCEPDSTIEDGYDFAGYGLDATALHLPGHSRGSIGVLTSDGDLFCGDLLESTRAPAPNALMDDTVALEASLDKLRGLAVKTVYPGHGRPFSMDMLA